MELNLFQYMAMSKENVIPSKDTVYNYPETRAFHLKAVKTVEGGVLEKGDFDSNLFGEPDKFLFIKTSKKYDDGDLINNGYYINTGIKSIKANNFMNLNLMNT